VHSNKQQNKNEVVRGNFSFTASLGGNSVPMKEIYPLSNPELFVEQNLDFILGHFQNPLFPRRIMTKRLGYQKEVLDKQSVLKYFRSSNYEDCRVNAYPSFTNFHGINRTPPKFHNHRP
jgi:hypothetical protein